MHRRRHLSFSKQGTLALTPLQLARARHCRPRLVFSALPVRKSSICNRDGPSLGGPLLNSKNLQLAKVLTVFETALLCRLTYINTQLEEPCR